MFSFKLNTIYVFQLKLYMPVVKASRLRCTFWWEKSCPLPPHPIQRRYFCSDFPKRIFLLFLPYPSYPKDLVPVVDNCKQFRMLCVYKVTFCNCNYDRSHLFALMMHFCCLMKVVGKKKGKEKKCSIPNIGFQLCGTMESNLKSEKLNVMWEETD